MFTRIAPHAALALALAALVGCGVAAVEEQDGDGLRLERDEGSKESGRRTRADGGAETTTSDDDAGPSGSADETGKPEGEPAEGDDGKDGDGAEGSEPDATCLDSCNADLRDKCNADSSFCTIVCNSWPSELIDCVTSSATCDIAGCKGAGSSSSSGGKPGTK